MAGGRNPGTPPMVSRGVMAVGPIGNRPTVSIVEVVGVVVVEVVVVGVVVLDVVVVGVVVVEVVVVGGATTLDVDTSLVVDVVVDCIGNDGVGPSVHRTASYVCPPPTQDPVVVSSTIGNDTPELNLWRLLYVAPNTVKQPLEKHHAI